MISNVPNHKHHHRIPPIHPLEIGFWGVGCTALNHLYQQLIKQLPHLKIGYYDIKHHDVEASELSVIEQGHFHLRLNQPLQSHQIIAFFSPADLLIVNGNHSQANEMWLILDGKKPYKPSSENLSKTSHIFYNDTTKAEALKIAAENMHIHCVEGCSESDIINHLINKIKEKTPALTGLILTGGNSTRMQQNKSMLIYHRQPQWLHLYDLMQSMGIETFISCTETNAPLFDQKPIIIDTLIGYGPLSGILSALLKNKNKAILVLACDLPLIDESILQELIAARDPSKVATAFFNEESGFLEPLIAIYEPRALPIMLQFLAQGYSCPRKMLMQSDILKVYTKNTQALSNVNFPEEREQIMKQLKNI
jgi:molybdopterin-guanine dinucleotide biosynthesis protein A